MDTQEQLLSELPLARCSQVGETTGFFVKYGIPRGNKDSTSKLVAIAKDAA